MARSGWQATFGWRREWWALSVALLALVAGLAATGTPRLSHLITDAAMALQARPAAPEIVLVTIDERSMAAIGRWPWRRALHAELLRKLDAAGVEAVGLDVLFTEPDDDDPDDDLLLERAIADSGRVVLPITLQTQSDVARPVLPLPGLTRAARALGHVHLETDEDGVARSIYRREGLTGRPPWPHLAIALLCVARPDEQACDGHAARPRPDTTLPGWDRLDRTLISFGGRPGHFASHAYIDVLRGTVPAEQLRGRIVLVGATAAGLGDRFATPVARRSRLMSGLEVTAHVLDGLLAHRTVVPAGTTANLVANLLPVALGLVALLVWGPLAALLTIAGLMAGATALVAASPLLWGAQLEGGAGLIGLALAYPLWSWRRLSATARYLGQELQRLRADTHALPLAPAPAPHGGDLLGRRIDAMEQATMQLRDLHRFVADSLRQLPQPMLVCDLEGRVLLGNDAAAEHFGVVDAAALQGRSASSLFEGATLRTSGTPLLQDAMLATATLPARSEGVDAQGRTVLLQCAPFASGHDEQRGWLLTLVNLTAIRRARQQRDEAMRFISHDIRGPNASILTLLEIQRAYPSQMPVKEMLARIERHARAGLDLAEGFVQLARAESLQYAREPIDLCVLLEEAVDGTWAQAHDRGVVVAVMPGPEEALTLGDRSLLARCIANLLNNAIKFGPRGGTVRCGVEQRPAHWAIRVTDEGPGIPQARRAQLFQAFERLHGSSHPQAQGIGLGLAFVRTVILNHGGTVEVDSAAGVGSTFRLVVPMLAGTDA